MAPIKDTKRRSAPIIDAPEARMLADLKRSGLDKKDIAALGFIPCTEEASKRLRLSRGGSGFLIPYFDKQGKKLPKMFRFRYFDTEITSGFNKGDKLRKYDQPAGTDPEVYLPPLVEWPSIMQDTAQPLIITEGEKKAACGCKHGFHTLGLGGVDVHGRKSRQQELLPALDEFEWTAPNAAPREVFICYDSDAVTNRNIMAAENRLARKLTDRGAMVRIVRIPPDGEGKVGMDDFIVKHGAEAFEKLLKDTPEYGPAHALHALNEEVLYVECPSMVVRYPKENHPKDQPRYRLLSLSDFTGGVYADRRHTDRSGKNPKEVSTAEKWIEWPRRAKVDSLTYAPGEDRRVGVQFNMWQGWGVEAKKGNVKPFLDFFQHITEGLSETNRRWLLQWFAWPLQHPKEGKLNTAVVFWTPTQGVGKTLLGETMGEIYGNNFSTVTKPQLDSTFNSWQQNKQFVMGEEITGSDAKDRSNFAETLKHYITTNKVYVNVKHIPEHEIPSFINYYFTSNHPNAFSISDQDRRYFIHEVIAPKLPDSFFTAYVKWLREEGGAAALFDYLLHVDLTGFNPDAKAPHTAARDAMVDATRKPADRLIRDLLRNPDYFSKAYRGRDLWTAQDLADAYHATHHLDPEARYINKTTLGLALKEGSFQTISTSVPMVLGTGKNKVTKWPTPYVLFNAEDYKGKTDKQLVAAYAEQFKPPKKLT